MTNTTQGRETKALAAQNPHVGSTDEAALVSSMMEALSAYRDANDARLDALEKRGANDVLLDEKLQRIDVVLDETTERLNALSTERKTALVHAQRPQLGGGEPLQTRSAHALAFDSYLRSGASHGLTTKAMEAGTDAEGGYLVPREAENTITEQLTAMSPMRMIATVRQVSSTVFRKPVTTTGFDAGWAAEDAARPETNSVTLSEIAFPTMELYAMPAATAALLDDAAVDMDAWIASEVDAAFAEQESTAFVSGNGTSQPLGFLTVPTAAEASWSWGNIGTVATGVDGAFPAIDPSEVLIDLVYTLKSSYRQNATFIMNRSTQAALRKMRDADGNYIWTPPASAGASATLLGFPVVEMEAMPSVASASKSIAFGDFRRGYLIVDRVGTRLLRDPYSNKPYVLFYVTKRVGGGVQDFDAIKLLDFSAA